jgi:tRNA-specific 2-thiouridylase
MSGSLISIDDIARRCAEGVPATVVVAMSGGVDSAVAAALLRQAGRTVIGITLQLYDHGVAARRRGACCAGEDIHDARRVADHLAIAHYVLDYEQRFRDAVIDSFAASYVDGETPIPCVACNSRIKFADLLSTALELGAGALATGHYIEQRQLRAGPALFRAADAERDQSYFLFATTRRQLECLRFPLGRLAKPEVREIARRLSLPVADKPDSQDICFVPSGRYTDVVERLRPEAGEPGDIVDTTGRVLGRHPGIMHFTVGQRRGLGVQAGEPLFVVRIDAARRQVVVGPRSALALRSIALRDVNWLGDGTLGEHAAAGGRVHARLRSSAPAVPARIVVGGDAAAVRLELDEPALGAAPGQAAVLYADGDRRARVLGGGWIDRVTLSREPAVAPLDALATAGAGGPLSSEAARS